MMAEPETVSLDFRIFILKGGSLVPSLFYCMRKKSGETLAYSRLVPCGKVWPWPIRLQNGAMSQAHLKKYCNSDLKEPRDS